eukprot:1426942-Pleurochrysis_carterae.AAC.1
MRVHASERALARAHVLARSKICVPWRACMRVRVRVRVRACVRAQREREVGVRELTLAACWRSWRLCLRTKVRAFRGRQRGRRAAAARTRPR